MKIRILGFEWKPTGNVTLSILRNALNTESARRLQSLNDLMTRGIAGSWDQTFFALGDKGDYWTGIVAKIRDQKLFCQVTSSSGKLVLNAKEMAEGKMVEVNFFVVNKNTGKGLYQYYHHSTWLDSFSHLCKRALNEDVLRRRQQVAELGSGAGWTAKQIRAKQRELNGTLVYSVLVREENFGRLLDELREIKQVRIGFRDDMIDIPSMGPLTRSARTAMLQFSYAARAPVNSIRAGIKSAVATLAPRRMRVEGKTAGGIQQVVKLANNFDAFAEFDFDEATADLEIDLSDPATSLDASGMIERLLTVAQQRRVKTILETPPSDD